MRKIVYFLATLGLTMIVSCGGNSAQREQEVQDSLLQDSIKKVEALNDSLRRDSIVKDSIRQDSMWRYRVTPDLAMFNLHGPVKSVKGPELQFKENPGNVKVNFSKAGKITSIESPIKEKYSIKRGSDGKVDKITTTAGFMPNIYKYTYDGNGRLKKINSKEDYSQGESIDEATTTIFYNEKGEIVKEKVVGGDVECGYSEDRTYTILNVDEYGNWTKRNAYVVNVVDWDGLHTTKESRIETRTITYYER